MSFPREKIRVKHNRVELNNHHESPPAAQTFQKNIISEYPSGKTSHNPENKTSRQPLFLHECPDSVQAKSLNTANAAKEQLASLISVCEAASFGRGTETVLDESYRKALKLDLSQFSTPLDLASTSILHRIQQDLVDTDTVLRRRIRTEPYKLNIYNKGAFFKLHKDSPRAENMFGSLVVVFPTPHEGGELAFAAFYSDVTHEILPVTSGARITLTFNLHFEDSTSESGNPVIPTVTEQFMTIKNTITELLAEPQIAIREIRTLCFGLSHSYPVKRDEAPGYNIQELSRLEVFHTGQEDPDDDQMVTNLGQDIFDPPDWEVIGLSCQLKNDGMEKVSLREMLWVTDSLGTGIKANYAAYGNDAVMMSVYNCIVVHL
ncbi:hypothetical protein BDP27DRAFT_1426828 [Rhodocollybia butyracea]|uniref:Prolyl 4-hydroxylase alpha subunit Fe(2+) 2OG dioxygenase domain-containing protein n=1 Tax=Rhodocollybia butyracea TaxID=206335 RepID=A0A9P5PHI1_9AGAR|nr:hypothetical protein BDP27DRAFT_1426828 [Rhodocollybia butyracea]